MIIPGTDAAIQQGGGNLWPRPAKGNRTGAREFDITGSISAKSIPVAANPKTVVLQGHDGPQED